MINLIKPGHILRFGVCPTMIISPPGVKAINNDNTLETHWPTTSHLGLVQCLSHPSGDLGSIAADVVKRLRTTANSISRMASYSPPGRFFSASNRPVGSAVCDFVGYVDGQTNYIASDEIVFSKDFSGCLMVVYSVNGQRRVAHAASSGTQNMDCRQAFLDTLQNMNAILGGWFKPIGSEQDEARIGDSFAVIGPHIGHDPNRTTTFGVITDAGLAYSIDAFKPKGIIGNDWIVTDVTPKVMSQNWNAG